MENLATEDSSFDSSVTVNHRYHFTAKSQLSQIDAENTASQNALEELCRIETGFPGISNSKSLPFTSNRMQIAILLNLVKSDCIRLYENYFPDTVTFKEAIRQYEVFMIEEINTMFRENNKFSEIVLSHEKHFQRFRQGFQRDNFENIDRVPNGIENCYAIFISLQEWQLNTTKEEQFYFMLDIDSFDLKTNPIQANGVQMPKVS